MLKLIIKRFLLIIIGIILSLVFLECGLRLAGWTISFYQQYKNNKALRNKSQYTIMCLGESTTARQYPIQLQQILDEKYPNKFSVIDCGVPSTNLTLILDSIENNIKQYNPGIAICMMGINDGLTEFNKDQNISYIKQSKNIKLKIYKLFLLLKKHLNLNLLFADNINSNLMRQYQYFRYNKEYEKAEQVLKSAILQNKNNEFAKAQLAYFYYFFMDKKDIGIDMAKQSVNEQTNDIVAKSIYYNIILNYCKDFNKNFDFYIKKLVSEDIDIFKSWYSFENYTLIKNNLSPKQKDNILNTIINRNHVPDIPYGFMAINEFELMNYKKAREYFDKAEEIRLYFPNIETYKLYKLIIKKLIDNNIKVICMQYPIRSIKPLQKQLKDESYYNMLTFISNEKLFKDALMNTKYNEIFSDQFAGDFGHCTNLGNTLIAENVVNTLENILDLREKSN